MTYVFELGKIFIIAAIAGFIPPFLLSTILQRSAWRTMLPLLLALALVGASAGISGGMSRSPAVGEIIPAFLGLLGGVAVYLFGVDQSKGLAASFGAAALAISLLLSYAAGSIFRATPEDHRELRALCAGAYTNADLLKDEGAFTRFRDMMGDWCDKSMNWRLTTPPPSNGPSQ